MKYKIEKNTVQETLIIPLYARKMCSELFPKIYCDAVSAGLIDKIDYDFSSVSKKPVLKSFTAAQSFILEIACCLTDGLFFSIFSFAEQQISKAATSNQYRKAAHKIFKLTMKTQKINKVRLLKKHQHPKLLHKSLI